VKRIRLWKCAGLLALLGLCGCQGLTSSAPQPDPAGTLQSSVNHIIFMAQENRSFDHYFGQLPAYWQANGYSSQALNVMPSTASNPSYDSTSTISAFHVGTECIEDLSPSWNESHVDWNRNDPTSSTPTLDGFVYNAAKYALNPPPGVPGPFYDTNGLRAMGYYDWTDLNYYYFMASNFAISDNWFAPAMTRSQPNRLYLLAATSAGHAYPPTTSLSNKTIFDLLEAAGISWKIYETDPGTSYIYTFQPFASDHASNVVPISQYTTDLQNGTLPAVALIEAGYNSGRDEHPQNNVQTGAAYVQSLIDALMNSSSWKDSVFILTYDEAGGLYDHVPPLATVNPDGVTPLDLPSTDICSDGVGANCDFNYTGYRVPLIVVSPFARRNYVSHTPADYTAILKLIETRFGLASLTKRDAAQMDMTEFFDFRNVPWPSPPVPPTQTTSGVCNFQSLQP
jgi:phospholipase C